MYIFFSSRGLNRAKPCQEYGPQSTAELPEPIHSQKQGFESGGSPGMQQVCTHVHVVIIWVFFHFSLDCCLWSFHHFMHKSAFLLVIKGFTRCNCPRKILNRWYSLEVPADAWARVRSRSSCILVPRTICTRITIKVYVCPPKAACRPFRISLQTPAQSLFHFSRWNSSWKNHPFCSKSHGKSKSLMFCIEQHYLSSMGLRILEC